jgi:CubicO group peptidase (beta-lactamase class C family)
MRRLLHALALAWGLAPGAVAAGPPSDPPALIRALGDPDPRARESAAAALGRLRLAPPEAIAALVAALGHEDLYLRGAASTALGRIGAPAVPALGAALEGGRPEVRLSAAIALARMGSAARPALAALVRALSDPDATLRYTAAAALGALGPAAKEAAPALTAHLGDRDESVRGGAALALAQVDPQGRAARLTRDALVAGIEGLLPALMQEHHVPGVSIALILDRKVAWTGAFGLRNAQSREPATPATVFEVASMSKPIFALLAMQLAEAGKLDLDRPVGTYGPEPSVPDLPDLPERRRTTARMLLSHTSGLPNWRPGGEEREGPIPQLFRPGSRFGYSGEGIFQLQRVVERITGEPLDRWAAGHLFGPLGLTTTAFAWTPEIEAQLATGHKDDGSALVKSKYLHPNAAYTLCCTAAEYGRLLVEVLAAERGHSRLLSRKSAREMLKRQVRLDARAPIERPGAARGLGVFWGLGWSLNATAQGDIAHHGGSNSTGFRSFAQFSPSRGTGIVILTNGSGGSELWTRLVAAIGDL